MIYCAFQRRVSAILRRLWKWRRPPEAKPHHAGAFGHGRHVKARRNRSIEISRIAHVEMGGRHEIFHITAIITSAAQIPLAILGTHSSHLLDMAATDRANEWQLPL